MENLYDILRRPLLTERSTLLKEKFNQYLFEVSPEATKGQIKQAVQEAFKVKVASVRTMTLPGKARRMGKSQGMRPDWKKAVVTLEKGQKIEWADQAGN